MRRNRHTEPNPETPERFDLGELSAQRERARAEADAQRPAVAPSTVPASPLAGYLDALNPRRSLAAALPPVALAAKHDEDLAGLLGDAQRAHGDAFRLAMAWLAIVEGGGITAADLDTDDAAAIVDALKNAGPWAFARARCAQRAAQAADDAARTYAAKATRLRDDLDALTDRLAAEIGALFEQTAARKDHRANADALDLAAEWREAAALYRWIVRPTVAYRPPSPGVIPAEVEYRQYEAAVALGDAASIVVPLDALDAPRRRVPR